MKQSLIILSVLLFVFSCKDPKDDTSKSEKPTITIINQSSPAVSEQLCGAPFDNVLKVATGDTLRFTFVFKGSNPLSQYKIDVHNNFDCHEHGKSVDWSVLKIVDLTGTEVTIEEELIVPQNASAGNYHMMIRLLDIYGYEADAREFNVIIYNVQDEEDPEITLTNPVELSTFSHGDQVHFEGTITDNFSLEGGKFQLMFTDSQDVTYNLLEEFYPQGTAVSYTIDINYTVGTFIPAGQGYFSIKAFDSVNNFSIKTVAVTISE